MAVAIGVAVAVTGTGRAKARPYTGASLGWSDGHRFARIGKVGRHRLGDVLHRADLYNRLLGLLQHEFFINGADLGLLFIGFLAAGAVFLGRGQRNVVLQVAHARSVFRVNFQRVLVGCEIHLLALGVNLVFAVGLVPLGDRRILVHVFDDLAPADAGVVRAEGNFALLRGVGNDAHLRAAEVVVEQILEPHPCDEQEVPRVALPPLHGVFIGAVGRSPAVFLVGILRERPSL